MKVLLANPRGFCAGVEMAIETVQRALQMYGAPLYVYHEIVHNRQVVDAFKRDGVVFVDHIHEVPVGGHLIYSAHGVSPEIHGAAQQRQLQVIDATCPLVRKVHHEALEFARLGYTILLIGHASHDEVVGTLGEVPDQMILVESLADIDALDFPPGTRLAYLTQTTLSMDDAQQSIERLRARFPGIVGPRKDDICYATQNRQEAVRALLPTADLVLVLGSQNSSNSNRLAELARERGTRAHLIDSVSELEARWFEGVETVLITAGASAPESSVQGCIDYLVEQFDAEIEEHVIREESAFFPLPLEVRHLPPRQA